MAGLLSEIKQRATLPDDELEWMVQHARRVKFERGEAFCRIGQEHFELGFVESGLLQIYEVTEGGDHVVLDFAMPGRFCLPLRSAISHEPTTAAFEALTPTTMMVWPYQLRLEAQRRHSDWLRLEIRLVEDAFARKQHRQHSLLTMDAGQRFQQILIEYPNLWRDIPQHLLASYLHVTPPYLSRLKRSAEVAQVNRTEKVASTLTRTRRRA